MHCSIINAPNVLIQYIFQYLEISEIPLVRSTCKYFAYGPLNKIFWKEQYKFHNLVMCNKQWCPDGLYKRNQSPILIGDGKMNEKATQIIIDNNMKMSDCMIDDILKNLHVDYPNLISVNLRECNHLPVNTLDYLAKIKNLMFVDIYCSNLTLNMLTYERVKKFLDQCPNLIEIDFTHMCGFEFPISDNELSLCRGRDIETGEYERIHSYSSYRGINIRDYPHIKSWNSCRFDVNKIKNYRILSRIEKYFN